MQLATLRLVFCGLSLPMSTRLLLLPALLLSFFAALAQPKTPADFGYRHLRMRYQHDTVDVLVL